jgi:hypothetical protein
MKRVTLALMVCFSLGCINVAYADVWGRIAHTVGKAWEDTKRETTKAAHTIDVNARTLEKDTRNFVKRNQKEIALLLRLEKAREQVN